MSEKLNFKISAALKNLIGKELITDEYIAVFELVKNAFDANSKTVKIIFENSELLDKGRIIIIDNGKGMNLEDLKNKWLFVGYSAKNDGTENNDYRDKIDTKRIFAGAKGIGRFSCDKLGASLNLITKKKSANSSFENIIVNWENFERDAKDEFVNIDVEHNTLNKSSYKNFEHGTVLEISKLREKWTRDKKLILKRSLEKLINPIQENDVNNFNIDLVSTADINLDEKENESWKKVNGRIKNFVFENLKLNTTQITTEIDSENNYIITTLYDRGRMIYVLTERNVYPINNIKITLFQLNRSSKMGFTKRMGIPPVQYGSVFLYKNGFRIYPFGEEGEDILGIDRRKQQGYNRFLGTRDLIGRIEINGDSPYFKETTSRDGGLEKNESFYQLVDCFYDKALKRLESYVVDIIKWGDELTDSNTGIKQSALSPDDVKDEIIKIISSLTKAKDIINIKYDEDFLNFIDSKQQNNISQIAKNFSRIARASNDDNLLKIAEQAEKHVKELISAKREVEKEKEVISEQLDQKTKQNLFLKSVQTLDKDKILNYHHDIGVQSIVIQKEINKLSKYLNNEEIDITAMLKSIDIITMANNKILAISRFATKANFNSSSEKIKANLVEYIEQYVKSVEGFFDDLKIHFINNNNADFIIIFKPIEICLIIDNLFNNSIKARAKNFNINVNALSPKKIELLFSDDGHGLDKSIVNPYLIFEKGFSKTKGSGLGLYHVHSIVTESLKGDIIVNQDVLKGFEMKVILTCN
jgi:signal transduction histidine kinase